MGIVKNRKEIIFVLLKLIILSLFLITDVAANDYETPKNRKAEEILPAGMLSGPHYRIREKVVSFGYMHHYAVDSDYGFFEVTGDMALRKLLKEIRAIAALKRVTESEAFIKSVGESAKKPLYFGKDLINEPVETITGVPKGVFKLFGNISTSLTKTHDPSEDARHEQMLLVSSFKRQYAYRLGVDVYSSNQVLQKELNKVGWAAAIGSLSLSAVTAGAGSTTVSGISKLRLTKSINEVLREEPPARLRLINEGRLVNMGVSENLTENFLDHPHFTPRHDTIIVECLRYLRTARGRSTFVEFALQADDEESANFFQYMAEIMIGYHEKVSPITEIRVIDGVLLAKAKNESVLIPFPLDYGIWTKEVDRITKNFTARYKASGLKGRLELWVPGRLTLSARKNLEGRGMVVAENVDQRIGFMD
jgi:hypothetical protein